VSTDVIAFINKAVRSRESDRILVKEKKRVGRRSMQLWQSAFSGMTHHTLQMLVKHFILPLPPIPCCITHHEYTKMGCSDCDQIQSLIIFSIPLQLIFLFHPREVKSRKGQVKLWRWQGQQHHGFFCYQCRGLWWLLLWGSTNRLAWRAFTASYLLLLLVIYLDSKLAFGMGFPDNLLHTSCCHCKSY